MKMTQLHCIVTSIDNHKQHMASSNRHTLPDHSNGCMVVLRFYRWRRGRKHPV